MLWLFCYKQQLNGFISVCYTFKFFTSPPNNKRNDGEFICRYYADCGRFVFIMQIIKKTDMKSLKRSSSLLSFIFWIRGTWYYSTNRSRLENYKCNHWFLIKASPYCENNLFFTFYRTLISDCQLLLLKKHSYGLD